MEVEMPMRKTPVERIQDISAQIRALEKRLLGDKPIQLSELAIIHSEIRRMRQGIKSSRKTGALR
jgi:hypothetical protein